MISSVVMEEIFEQVYTNPRDPGSFGGAEKLRRSLKKLKYHATIKSVKEWLQQRETYTKHRQARKNFKRNPVIATHIDAQWQGDLAEVGNKASSNDGVRYLLILIDVVSKYLWVQPLKSKNGPTVLEGFKELFSRIDRRPGKLQTDDGKEFLYHGVQAFLKENNIGFFTLKSDKKAALAERVIRTLKEKLWRYMHENHTWRYIDVLQDLVASYNDTYHASIKRSPSEVSEKNEAEVLNALYGHLWKDDASKVKPPKLKVGDFVRISRVKGVFSKGYTGKWTKEIFIIAEVIHSKPWIMYKIRDWGNEILGGSFYEHEVQLVHADLDGYWKVEEVLDTRVRRGKKEHLVKWEGYPHSLNSWVQAHKFKDIV
jgi:hypothetical protein